MCGVGGLHKRIRDIDAIFCPDGERVNHVEAVFTVLIALLIEFLVFAFSFKSVYEFVELHIVGFLPIFRGLPHRGVLSGGVSSSCK